MGADTTSTHLIFFIAATVVATAATGVFATTVLRLSDEVQLRGVALQGTLSTEIDVINDPENMPTDPLRIYVKNTGKNALDPALVTVLVDGSYVGYTATLLGGAEEWRQGDVAEYQVTSAEWTPAAGDHILRIVTANGVWDDLRFRI